MSWVDFVVVGVLGVSALLAFMRGLVREVLGVGAWLGAPLAAAWGMPLARDQVHGWFGNSPWSIQPPSWRSSWSCSWCS